MSSWKYLKTATLGTVTLGSSYTSGSGSMSLTAGQGARLPSTGDFWLSWSEDENDPNAVIHIWKVTARSTDTLTVTAEASEGGGDANVSSGETLRAGMPISAVDQLRQDIHSTGVLASAAVEKAGDLYLASDASQLLRYNGSSFAYWGDVYPHTGVPTSGWTFANQDSATEVSASGITGINKLGAGSANAYTWLYRAQPSTPYVITARFNIVTNVTSSNGDQNGWMFGFSDSISGRYHAVQFQQSDSMDAIINKFSSATSDSGGTDFLQSSTSAVAYQWSYVRGQFFVKIENNATNLIFSVGIDGYNFWQIGSFGVTSYLTNAPDRVAFGARGNNVLVSLDLWKVA